MVQHGSLMQLDIRERKRENLKKARIAIRRKQRRKHRSTERTINESERLGRVQRISGPTVTVCESLPAPKRGGESKQSI